MKNNKEEPKKIVLETLKKFPSLTKDELQYITGLDDKTLQDLIEDLQASRTVIECRYRFYIFKDYRNTAKNLREINYSN